MAGPNPVNRKFIQDTCATALAGINAIEAAAANANKYQAYFATALAANNPGTGTTPTPDFIGPYADLTPADIAAAISAVGAVQALLTANSNALMNALLKIGR